MKITINCLNKRSVDHAIKVLNRIKEILPNTIQDFLELSSLFIIKRAKENLKNRSLHFSNTTDINDCWEYSIKKNKAVIKNTSDYAAIVEFGVGMVGSLNPHKSIKESSVNYDYDVNQHGEKGWTFIRDLQDKTFNSKKKISSSEIKENPSRYLVMRSFTGYEGKEFFYDAIFDYLNTGIAQKIYKKCLNKYLLKK